MKFHHFKNNDAMPLLGLGTWKSGPGEVYQAVRTAIELGYRHFDCAFVYDNEAEIGEALAESIAAGKVKREDLWITSKLWNNSHPCELVLPALKQTLSDLQLDYLDLYLIHWPISLRKDVIYPNQASEYIPLGEIPLTETWAALEECYDLGLVRHLGVSNFSVKKLGEILSKSRLQPEVNQIEMHPFLQQPKMMEFCRENYIHLTAYSPLGSKDRAESMKGKNEPSLLEHPTILQIAARNQCSPAQVLIKWAMERGTSVIPKSVNPRRMKENLESIQVNISAKDMQEIAALDQHFRYLDGTFWTRGGSPYTLENIWDGEA
ncbi:MAG: aldo/keto reductase [Bacteroidia bacterium]|nr:aldo/keto reductase [Bacteroidia bacterium]